MPCSRHWQRGGALLKERRPIAREGAVRTIENRTYAGRSDHEAIRTAKDILLRNSPPPNAYGFSLKRQDRTEVCRWFNTEAHHAPPVLKARGAQPT